MYYIDAVVNAYSELFDRMDLDNDGYLNKSELDQYMMRTEGAPVQETAFQWLLHKFEGKEGELGLTNEASATLSVPSILAAANYLPCLITRYQHRASRRTHSCAHSSSCFSTLVPTRTSCAASSASSDTTPGGLPPVLRVKFSSAYERSASFYALAWKPWPVQQQHQQQQLNLQNFYLC
jgi:hypothetical protein